MICREVGLVGLAGMEREVSELLGRKTDMWTVEDLSLYVSRKVVASAEVQYGA